MVQVLAALQKELFRTLLMQSVEFFDRHDPTDLTALISVELNSLRTFVFKYGEIASCPNHHHMKIRRSARPAIY